MESGEAPVLKTALMKRLRPRLAAAPYRGASRLVLAVSGGRDSCVLLDVFWRMRHVHRSPLQVVHVDHQTGAHASEARTQVETLCRDHELPLEVVSFQWDGTGNFEHRASVFRREALAAAHGEDGYAVLAHHREDQSETLLMALARGAGITSPLGMKQERDQRLRPFLDVPSACLDDHARAVNLTWCEDPTNKDQDKFRNAIRHRVLPALTEFHNGVGSRFSGWVAEYHELQAQLFHQARQVLGAEGRATLAATGALRREIFERAPGYLWPFLLAEFWSGIGLAKPKRREHKQILAWLETGQVGCFDHAGRRFYCDSDVLTMAPQPELSPVPARLNHSVNWGLWRLRLDWPGADLPWTPSLRTKGFRWVAGVPLPKSWRERLRQARLPLRIRQHLPALAADSICLHFGELFALQSEGYLRVVRETGPDWSC